MGDARELATITREAMQLRAARRTFLLATVVRVDGSSYRRPGARMIVALGDSAEPERRLAGCVSGGCLETDVLLRGRMADPCRRIGRDVRLDDHVVPLSCRTRGLCPSCGGRRMETLTQHLMNDVLPYVPVRQWVLTLPYPLRYRGGETAGSGRSVDHPRIEAHR